MRIAMVIGGFLFALFGIVVVVVTLMSLAIDNVLTIGARGNFGNFGCFGWHCDLRDWCGGSVPRGTTVLLRPPLSAVPKHSVLLCTTGVECRTLS